MTRSEMLFLSQESQKLHDSYHDDVRTLYRIYARHARLLGAWAAEKLFLFGDKGNDYAVGLILTIAMMRITGAGRFMKKLNLIA